MSGNVMSRINKQFREESDRQLDIMLGGATLALSRYHGWGNKRLMKFANEVQDTWAECAANKNKSILMMLEEETGIELRMEGTGQSYHSLAYFNGAIDMKIENMSKEQIMYMRMQQIRWMGTTILASVMLSLHRIYGWGAERDTRLMHEIYDIKAEYNGRSGRIAHALKEETGIEMGYFSRREENGNDNQSGQV